MPPIGRDRSMPNQKLAIVMPVGRDRKAVSRKIGNMLLETVKVPFQNRSNFPILHVCISNPIKRTDAIPQFIEGADVQLLPSAANTSNERVRSTERKNTHPAQTR